MAPFTGALAVGQRYKLTFKLDGQRKERTMVAVYIGWVATGQQRRTDWSLRPVAGTTSIPENRIVSAFATEEPVRIAS